MCMQCVESTKVQNPRGMCGWFLIALLASVLKFRELLFALTSPVHNVKCNKRLGQYTVNAKIYHYLSYSFESESLRYFPTLEF